MIEFKTLGSIEVRRADGTRVRSVTARTKPLGLLAYLVLSEGEGARRREDVCALLWPESDEAKARNSLNQAIHFLRTGLGGEVLTGGRETVGVEPGLVQCDAELFRSAIDACDWNRALECYAGELLPGLHVPGSLEFERWLEGERQQLHSKAFHAARQLAAGLSDDDRARIRVLRQARRFRPDDDETVRDLIKACRRQGNVAAALGAFEAYRTWLADNFEIEPPEETSRLAETVRLEALQQKSHSGTPQQAASSTPDVTGSVAATDTEGLADAEREVPYAVPGHDPPYSPRRRLWLSLIAAVVLIVSLDAAWTIIRERAADDPSKSLLSEADRPPLDPDALAAPPFTVVSDDAALADLADDLPVALYTKVTGEFGPRVLDPRLVRTEWANIGSRSDLPPLRGEALGAVRGLAAGQLIHGTVLGTEEAMEIHASLIEVETGRTISQSIQRGAYDEWPTLLDRLVVDLLASHYQDLAERIPKLGDHRPEAVQAYLAGIRVWNRQDGDYEEITYFREAVERDSAFVLAALAGFMAGETDEFLARYAWDRRDQLSPRDRAVLVAGAGKLFGEIQSVRDEIDAWEKVLGLDPDNFQAHYELAEAYYGYGTKIDVPDYRIRAKRHARTALRHDPEFLWLRSHLFELAMIDGDSAAMADHLAVFDRVARSDACGRHRRHGQARAFGFELEPLSSEYGGLGSICEARAIIEGAITIGRSLDLGREATRAFDEAGGPTFIPLNMSRIWGWYDTWLRYLGRSRFEVYAAPPPASDALQPNLVVTRAAIHGRVPDSLAARSVRQLREIAAQVPSSDADREDIAAARCWLAQWTLSQRDTAGVAETISHLRENTPAPQFFAACASLLEAWRLRVAGLPSREALQAYDSLVRRGPVSRMRGPTGSFEPTQNLLLARWFREDGDHERALRAARRGRSSTPYVAVVVNDGYDMDYLREEAPLHVLVGDTAAAIVAYERYLAIREQANGAWALQLDSVRSEYLEITGGVPDS
jgi:DNA-binding SARP family transcriptional activator